MMSIVSPHSFFKSFPEVKTIELIRGDILLVRIKINGVEIDRNSIPSLEKKETHENIKKFMMATQFKKDRLKDILYSMSWIPQYSMDLLLSQKNELLFKREDFCDE